MSKSNASIKKSALPALLLLVFSVRDASAQTRRRIAVLPADHTSSQSYNNQTEQQRISVESKIVEALISKLANNSRPCSA
jgi:hypothetical protein